MIHIVLLLSILLAIIQASSYFKRTVRVKWRKVQGALTEITLARDFDTGDRELYGVSRDGKVWTCRVPCDGDRNMWTDITSTQYPEGAKHVAANMNEVWLTTKQNRIFRCTKPCTASNWRIVGGLVRKLTMNGDTVWAVNHFNDVFRTTAWPKQPVAWKYLSPGKKFLYVSVGLDGDVWGVMTNNNIVRFDPKDESWRSVRGQGKRIAVAQKHVYIIGTDDKLWRCKRPCTSGNWLEVKNRGKPNRRYRSLAVEWGGRKRIAAVSLGNKILVGKIKRSCKKRRMPVQPIHHWMPWQFYLMMNHFQQQQPDLPQSGSAVPWSNWMPTGDQWPMMPGMMPSEVNRTQYPSMSRDQMMLMWQWLQQMQTQQAARNLWSADPNAVGQPQNQPWWLAYWNQPGVHY